MKFVGIINITPDSFSDKGLYLSKDNAIKRAHELIAQGVSVIDIGGESRKPVKHENTNSTLVSAAEEWDRIKLALPDIIKISHENNVETSIDTRHDECAQKALDLGIDWINDANSGRNNKILELVLKYNSKIVLMHSLSVLGNHTNDTLDNNISVVNTLLKWGKEKIKNLQSFGINKNNIVFDPGIGYGKTQEQNWEIIRNVGQLKLLETKLYLGHSRKSMFSLLRPNSEPYDRDLETCIVSNHLKCQGVDFIRVHNIDLHNRFFATQNFLKQESSM